MSSTAALDNARVCSESIEVTYESSVRVARRLSESDRTGGGQGVKTRKGREGFAAFLRARCLSCILGEQQDRQDRLPSARDDDKQVHFDFSFTSSHLLSYCRHLRPPCHRPHIHTPPPHPPHSYSTPPVPPTASSRPPSLPSPRLRPRALQPSVQIALTRRRVELERRGRSGGREGRGRGGGRGGSAVGVLGAGRRSLVARGGLQRKVARTTQPPWRVVSVRARQAVQGGRTAANDVLVQGAGGARAAE